MTSKSGALKKIEIVPATGERWADIKTLFGARGACQGCWCMFWRIARAGFAKASGAGNRAALQELVLAHQVPGLLAYAGGQVVGWCSIGPREQFRALENSRLLKRVDDQPVS